MTEKFTAQQFERKGRKRRRPAGHHEEMFLCRHCHRFVSASADYSKVQNRNHCPICLHSRHLDLDEAGDRLSACKGVMRPVGITHKQSLKKYGCGFGELMLIHQCVECGKVSINRIAGDDDAERIFEHFLNSLEIPPDLRDLLETRKIVLLGRNETEFVISRLFGLGGIPIKSSSPTGDLFSMPA